MVNERRSHRSVSLAALPDASPMFISKPAPCRCRLVLLLTAAVSADGAVFAWDLSNLARVQDHVDKGEACFSVLAPGLPAFPVLSLPPHVLRSVALPVCVYHDLALAWGRNWEHAGSGALPAGQTPTPGRGGFGGSPSRAASAAGGSLASVLSDPVAVPL